MKKGLIALGIFAVFVGIYWFSTYNRLITLNEQIDNQWAQVEAQYQRRFDLIPNLVNSVKGIMRQEQEVFAAIADARTRYSGAATPEDRAAAANQVESALGRLLVITENYPQLQSSQTVQTLMAQLEGTENRISVERSRYNDGVGAYNMTVKRFPGSLIASLSGFEARTYFEAAETAEEAPAVNF
ncbi:MAG TPA: LemA family protein [Candidatus Paceibacterota bacterium]|nr:LemA family protein [Candidatus Paceibacterota bacterium]